VGRSTASPATGPYLGDNLSIVVNQPPVADAGNDATEECASHTGTEVKLDGTGSSDPDGDVLTYYWAADGIRSTIRTLRHRPGHSLSGRRS